METHIFLSSTIASRDAIAQQLQGRNTSQTTSLHEARFSVSPFAYGRSTYMHLRRTRSIRESLRSLRTNWLERLQGLGVAPHEITEIWSGNSFDANVLADMFASATCFGLSHGLADEVGGTQESFARYVKKRVAERIESFVFSVSPRTFSARAEMIKRISLRTQFAGTETAYIDAVRGLTSDRLEPCKDRGKQILLLTPSISTDQVQTSQVLASMLATALGSCSQYDANGATVFVKTHPGPEGRYPSLASSLECEWRKKAQLAELSLRFVELPSDHVVESWIIIHNPDIIVSPVSTTVLYSNLNGFEGMTVVVELIQILDTLSWRHDRWRMEFAKWEPFLRATMLELAPIIKGTIMIRQLNRLGVEH